MMIGGEQIPTAVADALGVCVTDSTELDGGEVGRVFRVSLADGRTVAAKTGDTPLDVEAYMLAFLGERGLPVPELHYRSDDLLVMEYVEGDGDEDGGGNGSITPAAERDVASRLAALHEESPEESASCRRYGFPRDTLSGPYRQPNPWTDSWVAFFRDHRLLHVTEAAREAGVLSPDLFDRLSALADDLDSWFPESPQSSLLHGDVWANNLVVDEGRVRAFLDPACYFGHAEVELAYVDFAGFGDSFFDAYEDERAIATGFFEGRREIYRLYPLLEHLLYFEDGGYAAKVKGVLSELGY